MSFKKSTPEKQGVSSRAITSFLKSVNEKEIELHSFMFVVNGSVISEGSWDPYELDRKHFMFSLTKSITATAIGFALDEKLLSLEDKVISFFPEYSDLDIDIKMNDMTVEHLLTMTSGYIENISGSTVWGQKKESWVKEFLELPLTYEPGTQFVYNSGSSHMLSAIISKVTNESMLNYLQAKLFEPLGIKDIIWDVDPEGNNTGGWGVQLKTEDVAKFGQFYLQKGQWNKKQLLSKEWFENATSFKVSNSGLYDDIDKQQGYGYQFWIIRNGGYRAAGKFGQLCFVFPQHNVVAVFTAGTDRTQELLDLFLEHIYFNIKEDELKEDDRSIEQLQHYIKKLSVFPDQSYFQTKKENDISGKEFKVKPNIDDIESIQLDFSDENCVFKIIDTNGEHKIECGLGYWIESKTTMPGAILHHMQQPNDLKVTARGIWVDNKTFSMTWTYINMPFSDTILCCFEGNKIIYKRTVNINGGTTERPTIIGSIL